MDLQKYKPLITSFLSWYNTLEIDENPYKEQLTFDRLNLLDKESFVKFFYDFYAEGGQVQSGGHRTKNRFRETLVNDYETFRAYLLQPFNNGFQVLDWLEERKKFNQWGEGISTIYLNRIQPNEYPVINNKTMDGLKLLGFAIRNSYPYKYEEIKEAQRSLMNEFTELRNFYVTDRLNQYIVGETEGQQMIREINPELFVEMQQEFKDPLRKLIETYKQQLSEQWLDGERYKWKAVKHFQEKWDPDAANFGEMFADAIGQQVNLIDRRPNEVIRTFCKEYPDQLREMIGNLYREELPLPDRIREFQVRSGELMKLKGKNQKDFQDERSISLYLFLRFPENYIHYKNSYYTELLRLSGIPKLKAGDKFIHFQQIAGEFKVKYILPDGDLLDQVQSNLTEDLYQDPSHNLLTQDVLYFLDQNSASKPEINFWIFQGNPAFFDFETAFRDNLIDNWTVSSHHEKIKTGDKVILWLTGEQAGCIGLADVTGTPFERKPTADDHLWKTEDKSQWQVGIKITKNLFFSPILWNEIQMDSDFEKLQVGNRGTNFSATKEQYDAIENIANAENVDFMQTLMAFPRTDVLDFYEVMRKTIKKFGLKSGDQRVIYNTRKDRLSFTVGQRYAFNYFTNDTKGKFGFISEKKINEQTGSFTGNPVAYYVHCDNIELLNEHESSFFNAIQAELNRTFRTSFRKHNNVQFEQSLFDYANKGIFMNERNNDTLQLNQILYGPPGTGKTYNTINMALETIGENTVGLSRTEIKNRFDKLMEEGRIVFTTFHQSMVYEDFIEGIKPVEPEKDGDPVIYKIEYGILRRFCIEAAFAIGQLRESTETADVLDFSMMYDGFVENLEELLAKTKEVELETKAGGSVLVESISSQGNIIIKHHNGQRSYTVSKARLTKLQSAISNLDEINNINDQFRAIIGGSNSSAYWSVLNAIRKDVPKKRKISEPRTYTWDEKKDVVLSLRKEEYKGKNAKPFVLIIDEINRGNVSQIFGEIITLIEKDKRLGNDEALEVTLPYSKEKFGVPPNIYIMGTMNTADRSVEALDTALRRRFSFVEMAPRYDLEQLQKEIIEGVSLSSLLQQINRRIEKLLDKDHMIGHSYFLCVKNVQELQQVFRNNIIPLLQEYFYGDIGKIALVLDTGFFEDPPKENKANVLATVKWYEHGEDLEERVVVHLKNIDKMDESEFESAICKLMNKPKDETKPE
jgi:5-methylcytosine-specific restriction protein B